MKILPSFFTMFFFSITSIVFAQFEIQEIAKIGEKFEIHEIGITVDTLDELKTIHWDDLFNVFELDQCNSKITFFVELKDVTAKDKKNNDVHFTKLKFEVSGYESERYELQKQLSSIAKKIFKNHQG